MAEVTASLVVNFDAGGTADGQGILKAEFDSRDPQDGGLNPNGTSFRPGDQPVFLVYKTDSVNLDAIKTSEGSTALISRPSIQQEEWITFANVAEASLSYPAEGAVTILKSVGMPNPSVINGSTLRVSNPVVGVVKVRYNTRPTAYQLNGASGENPVVIFVSGVVN